MARRERAPLATGLISNPRVSPRSDRGTAHTMSRLPEVSTPAVELSDWPMTSSASTVRVARAGDGPPILLFHGIGASWQWWLPNLLPLSKSFSVLAVDLPGFGQSPPTSLALTDDFFRSFVAELTSRMNLGPVVLVAHSLGGYVALHALLAGNPGVRALALVDSAGFGSIHLWQLRALSVPVLGEALMALPRRMTKEYFVRSFVYRGTSVTADVLAWADASLPAQRSDEFLRQLRIAVKWGTTIPAFVLSEPVQLGVPVRLFWGAHDPVFPVRTAYGAQRLLGADPPLVFPNSGHIPQLEEASSFNAAVSEFASSLLDT